MADLEANVPQQIENLFHHFRGIRRDARAAFIVEEHHVHVAKGIELAAAVTAERDHRQPRNSFLFRRKARHQCKDMTQHDIEQLNAKRADFPATATRLVPQPDPMLLDLDEFLVERKRVGGSFRARCGKAALGVGQNFFEVTRRGHGGGTPSVASTEILRTGRSPSLQKFRARSRSASSCCKASGAESRGPARLSSCSRDTGRAPR